MSAITSGSANTPARASCNSDIPLGDVAAVLSYGQGLTIVENTVFHAPWIMIFLSYLTPILKA